MILSNNTIAVTGAGSGIGLAIAKEFAKYQNQLILIGRDQKKLKTAQESIPCSHYYCCDLANDVELCLLIDTLINDYKELNMIINNAGMLSIDDLLDTRWGERSEEELFRTNYFAPVRLIDGLLGGLRRQERSAIVNVTTALVHVPFGAAPAYCASKSALHSYTSSLRVQLSKSTIDVFEIFPPVVTTTMSNQLGLKGISPQKFACEVLNQMRRGREEIRVGQARLLYNASRLFPQWILGKVNEKTHILLKH